MKKEDFDGIMQGLREARAHARGEDVPGLKVHLPESLDVAAIRKRTGLSQGSFANTIAVPVGTLRNWEQKRRQPEGPARVLLALLDRNPNLVAETLIPKSRDQGRPHRSGQREDSDRTSLRAPGEGVTPSE
jgi:putative transcriptional regulator